MSVDSERSALAHDPSLRDPSLPASRLKTPMGYQYGRSCARFFYVRPAQGAVELTRVYLAAMMTDGNVSTL